MLRLEPRAEAPRALWLASPLFALVLTALVGVLFLALLGKDPLRGLEVFFVEPLKDLRALSELSIKATPLILIGLGLMICFRGNVWNIGAEGQFVIGAIFAAGVAIRATPATGGWIVAPILLAGAAGGALWAAIVALLRDRFNANEILVSLMLVYVAELVLGYLVHGPWKDPQGYNFPQTITFLPATSVPRLFQGLRANLGLLIALALAPLAWLYLVQTHGGFRLRVVGLAPLAARYAGFSARAALWTALLVSGALAGLAGALEVAGPVGQLTPHVPMAYGFTAIIVAFVGRLHPFGVVLSGLALSVITIGGELGQSRLGLPRAVTGMFQGLLLFALLICDAGVRYRIRLDVPWKRSLT